MLRALSSVSGGVYRLKVKAWFALILFVEMRNQKLHILIGLFSVVLAIHLLLIAPLTVKDQFCTSKLQI